MHILKRGAGSLAALAALCVSCLAAGADYQATPSNYREVLKKLAAGDTLVMSPGLYLQGLQVHRMVGTPAKPIVIKGPESPPFARIVARADANTVSIINSAHVEIYNLEVDINGLDVDGVRAEGHADWAHHIRLENLRIFGHGPFQSAIGISTFCPAWNWVIRGNTITGAGTGMYLGQSDGTSPFVAGIVEHNLVVDSLGYNMQIKHQGERPRLAGMPVGKSVTIIRHNVFAKSANSSVGKMARPNLFLGHLPLAGTGADDTYAVYGNFFYQNPTEALFQAEGNVAFYGNVLVNAVGDAINIQPHNDVPRRVDVFHNTVIAANTGIRISGGNPAYAQRVFANAVFSATPIEGGDQHANRTGTLAEAAAYLVDPFAPPGRLDLSPLPGKLTTAPVDHHLPLLSLPDLNRDFDGRPYAGAMAGAYAGNGAVRRLVIEIKR